jgi:hypothetical protein
MNMTVEWDNEDHNIVRLTLHDGWTWEQLYETNKNIAAMMREAPQTVHLLLDYTQTKTLPMGGVIMHARNIMSAYPANWGLFVVVTRNMLVQRLATIFRETFKANLGKRVMTVTTFDDAYRMIKKHGTSTSEIA